VGKGTEPDKRPDSPGSNGSVPTLLLERGKADAVPEGQIGMSFVAKYSMKR
jgi:hypothetical protein